MSFWTNLGLWIKKKLAEWIKDRKEIKDIEKAAYKEEMKEQAKQKGKELAQKRSNLFK